MSSGDARARHRGLSHHTLTVLELLLGGVTVALPAGMSPPAGAERHEWLRLEVDLPGFAASGLPAQTMGRGPAEDPLFFAAALAGGAALAERADEGEPDGV